MEDSQCFPKNTVNWAVHLQHLAQPPSVNNLLGELASAGLAEVSYRSIRTIRSDRLAELAR